MERAHYQLREGVFQIDDGMDFYLVSEIPFIAVKVNKAFYHILSEINRSGSLPCPPEQDRLVRDLLDRLIAKGLLTKVEATEVPIYPLVTIIVPVKNRPNDIRECVTSLDRLDYPRDKIEIIVIDDGSTDSTGEVIKSLRVRSICLTQSVGASACRNLAAKDAKGELIGFIDSDCVAQPEWLKELVPYFAVKKVGIVGGYVSSFNSRSLLDRYEEVKSPLNMGSRLVRCDDEGLSHFYVPSCNLIVRAIVFREVGGFHEDLHVGEDVDLCWRIRKSGYQLLYVPRGEVRHKHRAALLSLLRRRFDYGTSEAILHKRHREKRKIVHSPLFPSLFWMSISLSIILQCLYFLILGAGIVSIDLSRKHFRVKKAGLRLAGFKVFRSVTRSYFSFSYMISSYLFRYYIFVIAFLSFFCPNVWWYALFLFLFSGLADFLVKPPKINFFIFLFFYAADRFAYQAGVIWGCIKRKSAAPLLPSLMFKHLRG